MSPVHATSCISASVAGGFGGLLTLLFHFNRGAIALPIGLAFGVLSAFVGYLLVFYLVRRRYGNTKPVFGELRGSVLGTSTFLISVSAHTALFPGAGGFLSSIFPIMFIGLVMFGWIVALIGAELGAFCERHYFP